MPDEPSNNSIDDQIAATRANTALSSEMMGQRLEQLYRQKFNDQPTANQPATETRESIDQNIEAVRNNTTLDGERKGEKLLELYRQRGSIEKAAKEAEAADPQAVAREVDSEMRNAWGSQFEAKVNGIAEVALDVFGNAEQFKSFSEKLALGRDEQVDAMHQLSELAGPVKSEMPIEEANKVVTERLRSMWGDRADQEFEYAQKFCRAIPGGLEAIDKFFIERGWDENPGRQVRAIVLFARLGKTLKN